MALSEQFGSCVSCCIVALVAPVFMIDIDFSAFLCSNSSDDKNEQSGIITQVTRQLKRYSTLYVKFRQIQAPSVNFANGCNGCNVCNMFICFKLLNLSHRVLIFVVVALYYKLRCI